MKMFSFEGEFRRKPRQSLGGSSRKEEKNLLLQRNQEERRKREEIRKRNTSAVKIQSFYRGYKLREHLKAIERGKFDRLSQSKVKNVASLPEVDSSTLFELWRKLLFFYNYSMDGQRLTLLCQLCIKHQMIVLQEICKQRKLGVHSMKNLLWLCCKHLRSIATSSMPLAIPLRMLEIYTHPQSYTKCVPHAQAETIVHDILHFLIINGYYKCMRVLIEEKIPCSIEHSTTPPTPMAGSVLELVKKPLMVVTKTNNPHLRNEVLQSLSQELFCPQHLEQTRNFILPALSEGSDPFPFTELLGALIKIDYLPNQTMPHRQLNVDGSVWLMYTILSLGQKSLERLNASDLGLYLGILHQLSSHLQVTRSKYGPLEDEASDDDMELDDMLNSLTEVQRECVRLIDEPAHIRCLLLLIKQQPQPSNILAICSICHMLMSEQKAQIHKTRLLYTLALSPWFISTVWHTCRTVSTDTVTGSKMPLLQLLSGGLSMNTEQQSVIIPLVSVFSSLFSHSLFTLHDAEFYGDSPQGDKRKMPFHLHELLPMCQALRDACLGIIELAHPDTKPALKSSYSAALHSVGVPHNAYTEEELYKQTHTWAYLFKVISRLVKQLYSRDSRRSFCPFGEWLSPRVTIMADKPSQIYNIESEAFQRRAFGARSALNPNRLEEDGPPLSTIEVRNLTILTELPFVVSFKERVKIFTKLLNLDHIHHQRDARHYNVGPMINIMVRRTHLYEDAFDRLSQENEPNMKLKVQVQLKNFQDLDEAGIDGGGIFREFMAELVKTAFEANRGFFRATNDKLLYPNPQANLLIEDYVKHYFFLGRILGKILYENMLIELPFATFFLNKILSRHGGGNVDIHQLASLDPEMYRNLLFLKDYEGDVSDLGLDFSVVNNELGEAQIEELKPGGCDIPVTNHNRIEYVHLMADYRLNKQIRVHCHAFRQGLADVINIDWLRMFDHRELQVLISGAPVPIDLSDLRRHTNYSGGYGSDHPVILTFWKVVETFTDDEKRHLLKFVTSCSRPPLLGFKELYPAFCVQYGGAERDRLPTASTCMNLLKLPEFQDERVLKEKLLYAIKSGSGFELS